VKVVTTNVDDLHERAGSKNVVHLHGVLTEVVENYYGEPHVKDIGYTEYDPDGDDIIHGTFSAKPNVVFFGEDAPMYTHLWDLISETNESDILVVIGSSNQVVGFDQIASQFPGLTYNINPESNDLDFTDYTADVRETATDGLRLIKNEIVEHMNNFRINTDHTTTIE
jgi:NAD-dependent deacetylase